MFWDQGSTLSLRNERRGKRITVARAVKFLPRRISAYSGLPGTSLEGVTFVSTGRNTGSLASPVPSEVLPATCLGRSRPADVHMGTEPGPTRAKRALGRLPSADFSNDSLNDSPGGRGNLGRQGERRNVLGKSGEPPRNRTENPQIKSLLLCQLS